MLCAGVMGPNRFVVCCCRCCLRVGVHPADELLCLPGLEVLQRPAATRLSEYLPVTGYIRDWSMQHSMACCTMLSLTGKIVRPALISACCWHACGGRAIPLWVWRTCSHVSDNPAHIVFYAFVSAAP